MHHIAPGDIATIYDVTPLYNAGIDGTGQKIVVLGQTSINLSDIEAFRTKWNLPANDPQIVRDPTQSDPGMSQDDLPEADLDLEWAGAVAKNASIIYVYSDNTFDAASYAIDQNLAPVMTISYGFCEGMDLIDLPTFQQWAQQANAQGIDVDGRCRRLRRRGLRKRAGQRRASRSGHRRSRRDSRSDFRRRHGIQRRRRLLLGFHRQRERRLRAVLHSRKGVERHQALPSASRRAAEASARIFRNPSWQTGPGVPEDGFRDVPDVAFPASPVHDTVYVYTGGAGAYFGGTSVAAPVFAGMVALLNHYLVSTGIESQPGLGNINPALYRLAANTSGLFHDVITGDNSVPCGSGSPNCSNGSLGYAAVLRLRPRYRPRLRRSGQSRASMEQQAAPRFRRRRHPPTRTPSTSSPPPRANSRGPTSSRSRKKAASPPR